MKPRLVLFDLGGVLIELAPLKPLWFGTREGSEKELWDLWLTCGPPSRMDGGELTTDEFITLWRDHWKIPESHGVVKRAYEDLIVGPLPGALNLVRVTAEAVRVGCLTNMNPSHWPKVCRFGFGDIFDPAYVSHLAGCAKPGDRFFKHVIANLPCSPADTFFLDDNQLNIEAARRHGLRAELCRGVEEARTLLTRRGVLASQT